jgi:hypothetical protein
MYNWVFVVEYAKSLDATGRDAATAKFQAAMKALPGAVSPIAQPSPQNQFKLNGGDLVCRAAFPNRGGYQSAANSDPGKQLRALMDDKNTVASLNEVTYNGGLSGGTPSSPTIYRVAFFYANVDPSSDRLDQFRKETSLMPKYIKTIQRWQLSTISSPDTAKGLHPWTHVWEQEYAQLAGLTGTYLMHPDHWAHVDRWFDPEYPEFLVDPVLMNTFCPITSSVIAT